MFIVLHLLTVYLLAADNLAMRSRKPRLLLTAPAPPRRRRLVQPLLRARAVLNRRLGKRRRHGSLCPEAAPPRNLLLCAVAPRAGAARHITRCESRLLGPGVDHAAGVGLAAVGARVGRVKLQPVLHAVDGGMPDEAAKVGLARGDDAARLGHAAHLAQDVDGVFHVLEHLVADDDVKGLVWEWESVGIALDEIDVGDALFRGELAGLDQDGGSVLQAGDVALRQMLGGQVDGDGAGAAADVEDFEVWLEMGEKIGGGVCGGAPGVGAQDRGVVAVRVSGALCFGHIVDDSGVFDFE